MREERERIRRTMLEREIREEAKNAKRKELEDFYTQEMQEDAKANKVNYIWQPLCIISILATIMMIAVAIANHQMADMREGTIKDIAQELCEERYGENVVYTAETELYTTIRCETRRIEMPKRSR